MLMQSKHSLDKPSSYMDLEEPAKHMFTTPYATSCMVRGKSFSVWLPQALLPFSFSLAGDEY